MSFVIFVIFFFFKQKTAYEMRISDWSSDVCSSDLVLSHPLTAPRHRNRLERGEKKAPADRSAGAPGEKQEDRTSRSAQARKREISMPRVSMTVNGRSVSGDVEGRTLLVQFLREHQHLPGPHEGCEHSPCKRHSGVEGK